METVARIARPRRRRGKAKGRRAKRVSAWGCPPPLVAANSDQLRRGLAAAHKDGMCAEAEGPTRTDKGAAMSGVRVLVGTRKGAFVLTSDGKRREVGRQRPALRRLGDVPPQGLAGRPEPHLRVAVERLVRPDASSARTTAARPGKPVGNKFVYDGAPGTHQWYDGTPHPWEFKRVWHLEPSLTDPDTVYAGVEDAALFRTTDGGQTWQELAGLRDARLGPEVAARRRRPVPAHDPARSRRTPSACSSRSRPPARSAPTTAGRRGRPINQGLQLAVHPRPGRRGRPLRAPHRHAPVAARTCCSCRSTGT